MKRKVLIIDDEEDLCLLMRSYLSPQNFEVHLALTLKDGFQKAKEVEPDVLFLDNNLPDGIGWDAVNKLHELLPESKINLMSAYTHPPKALLNIALVRFLEKPISLRMLESSL